MPEKSSFDGAWKRVLERYFRPFVEFFLPDVAEDIDWQHPFSFLDQELEAITPRSKKGRRIVDKLIRVRRKSGDEALVLVHVEVQAWRDANLAERMHVYNNRIHEHHGFPVASVAVFGDSDRSWRPDHFARELWGTEVRLKFRVIKLLDWESRWEELERHENPLAWIVMAHLRALGTRHQPAKRLHYKWTLLRTLFEKGMARDNIEELFRFIDWVLVLPEDLEREFRQTLTRYEEEMDMPRLTSIERFAREEGLEEGLQQGIQKGIQKGIQEGLRSAIVALLRDRFGSLPGDLTDAMEQVADEQRLKDLVRLAATAESLKRFLDDLRFGG